MEELLTPNTPLTGILPVAPTPFHADGRIDEEGMRRVSDCMIDQGVDAIAFSMGVGILLSPVFAEVSHVLAHAPRGDHGGGHCQKRIFHLDPLAGCRKR
jgi:hypothetical protein